MNDSVCNSKTKEITSDLLQYVEYIQIHRYVHSLRDGPLAHQLINQVFILPPCNIRQSRDASNEIKQT